MSGFKGECAHFSFNKCPIYTHDGASAKFSTNSHETDNSADKQATINPDKSTQPVPDPHKQPGRQPKETRHATTWNRKIQPKENGKPTKPMETEKPN